MFTTLNRGTLLLLFNMINKEYTMDHLRIFNVCVHVCVCVHKTGFIKVLSTVTGTQSN